MRTAQNTTVLMWRSLTFCSLHSTSTVALLVHNAIVNLKRTVSAIDKGHAVCMIFIFFTIDYWFANISNSWYVQFTFFVTWKTRVFRGGRGHGEYWRTDI